jgi:hypothetical protein
VSVETIGLADERWIKAQDEPAINATHNRQRLHAILRFGLRVEDSSTRSPILIHRINPQDYRLVVEIAQETHEGAVNEHHLVLLRHSVAAVDVPECV